MNHEEQIKQEEWKNYALEDEVLEGIAGGLKPELSDYVSF